MGSRLRRTKVVTLDVVVPIMAPMGRILQALILRRRTSTALAVTGTAFSRAVNIPETVAHDKTSAADG